jgi:hypothetical protein
MLLISFVVLMDEGHSPTLVRKKGKDIPVTGLEAP